MAAARVQGVSVVVPVYNSADTLPLLVERLERTLSQLGAPFEVILVNDGSQDASWEVVCKLAGTHETVRGVALQKNYGQHNALLCGIRAARHDITVTLDDDLQNPPEDIPRLLAPLDDGWDVVYGTPARGHQGYGRRLASSVLRLVLHRLLGATMANQISPFRAFPTRLRDAFADYRSPCVSIDALLSWGTDRFASVPVPHAPRTRGVSTYTLLKLVAHAVNVVTSFSTAPLCFPAYLGMGLAALGAVLATSLALCDLNVKAAPALGTPFLVTILCLVAGAQLLSIGILGAYLARMHAALMGYPAYVVRQVIERPPLPGLPAAVEVAPDEALPSRP